MTQSNRTHIHPLLKPGPGWTLFLDRDGVINRQILNYWIRDKNEFEWQPGLPEAIAFLAPNFERIIVVTNQRGITINKLLPEELSSLHAYMKQEIEACGGRIDAIYHCPHDRDDDCNCRKPEPGMALQAQHDFPEIDFARSLMIGDSPSDMGFGRNLGMKTIFMHNNNPLPEDLGKTDLISPNLNALIHV